MNAGHTNIVLGYTPAPHSRAALVRAIEIAHNRSAHLVVVNATPGDRYSDPSFATSEEIGELERQLRDQGVSFEIRRPMRGRDGGDEVVATADEVGAELIVIGLRRRSAVGKLLLGSIAQRILLDAHCDVLAVKP
ncbi:universal stress protein [Nocardioides sp. NPDC101246]|uniref:universal stress protein n=1 Tax=Nocardioides sp. NPDC101246 TaxID=3364336 RepID=UPI0038142EFA